MDILCQILEIIEKEHPGITDDRPRLERLIRINCGGDQHYIASAAALDRQRRDAEIRRAHLEKNVPVSDLATRHGLTPRQVRNIVAAH